MIIRLRRRRLDVSIPVFTLKDQVVIFIYSAWSIWNSLSLSLSLSGEQSNGYFTLGMNYHEANLQAIIHCDRKGMWQFSCG